MSMWLDGYTVGPNDNEARAQGTAWITGASGCPPAARARYERLEVYGQRNPSAFHRIPAAAAYAHTVLEDMSTHAGAEPGPGKDVLPVTQADREEVVETLQHAAGDGRLPLDEFSERVSMALTAETRHQLEAATAGLKAAPPVGSTPAVSSIVTFFGHRRQVGRWRLPGALRARALFGDLYLDLREVTVHDDVVDISATTLFGNLTVDVPEGVEVELTGFDVLGDRELRLAPVPRRPGTPFVRVRAHGLLGDVYVRTPAEGEQPPSWWSWFRPSRW
jgi:hypothetical protein